MCLKTEKRFYPLPILSDPKVASQIAFGIPVQTISFEVLRSGTKTVLTDTNQIIQEMQSGKFFALRAEGDFGNAALRDEIYKRNGFTKLKGNTYPHHDQTWGIFPSPLGGNAYYYSGLMEQIYANHVAHSDNASFVMKVALVTAMALA